MCCDEFYLPSLLFKNAYGFPQDREIAYNIYPTSDGSVLWEVRVHGLYYQPMDFRERPRCEASCAAWQHLVPAGSTRPCRCNGNIQAPSPAGHFPFDSFDLSLELRFTDPTILVDTTWLWGSSHPGVKVVPSSGGKKVARHALLPLQCLRPVPRGDAHSARAPTARVLAAHLFVPDLYHWPWR